MSLENLKLQEFVLPSINNEEEKRVLVHILPDITKLDGLELMSQYVEDLDAGILIDIGNKEEQYAQAKTFYDTIQRQGWQTEIYTKKDYFYKLSKPTLFYGLMYDIVSNSQLYRNIFPSVSNFVGFKMKWKEKFLAQEDVVRKEHTLFLPTWYFLRNKFEKGSINLGVFYNSKFQAINLEEEFTNHGYKKINT